MHRYTLLLWLLALPIILLTAWQALRYRDARYFWQRLGLLLPKTQTTEANKSILIHAASVGELKAALPLINALKTQFPDRRLLVTTTTPGGGIIARQQLSDTIQHCYLPIDWRFAVKRLLNHVQPCCVLIMETEIWPHLYASIHQRHTPLIIVNARLSKRSLKSSPWLRALYAETLTYPQAILARSKEDQDRYIELGAAARKIQHIGNIKFAPPGSQDQAPINLPRPYWLAASTHDDEELQLAKLWLSLPEHHHTLLVIVPRHPKRNHTIIKQLQNLTQNIAQRSKQQPITTDTHIYLADTFGELPSFIEGAEWVFMGGSLVPTGGHNILEVAHYGKAVVFGPHMDNFIEEAQWFLDETAAIQVESISALKPIITQLLTQPEQASAMGNKAQQLMAQQSTIIDDYLKAICQHCPTLK